METLFGYFCSRINFFQTVEKQVELALGT